MFNNRINYSDLIQGFEFPPASFSIEPELVAEYASAVGNTVLIYEETNSIPPTAAIAFAMAALSRSMTLPPGAIHVSQDMEFFSIMRPGDTITSKATVTRNQKRGQLHMLSISLLLFNQVNKQVAAACTEFILPPVMPPSQDKP